jgi:hypothetical protein
MKKGTLSFILAASFYLLPNVSFAWGAKGHGLVAEIAFHFLDDSTKLKVKKYLGNLTIEEAANWMDDSKSNSYYDYMRTWHYLDIDKGQHYTPSSERNIITVLYSAINELKGIDKMKKKDIKRDLLLIFHLMGDLHQPLHTGYTIDKGGNTINVTSQNFASNLHSAWDTQILESEGVTLEKCLAVYKTYSPEKIDSVKRINVLGWMNQSRSCLDFVYDYKNDFLDATYIQKSVVIIENQLLNGGMRLASVLTETFKNFNADLSLNNYHYQNDLFPSAPGFLLG